MNYNRRTPELLGPYLHFICHINNLPLWLEAGGGGIRVGYLIIIYSVHAISWGLFQIRGVGVYLIMAIIRLNTV